MPQTASIFRSPAAEAEVLTLYEAIMTRWPVEFEELLVSTSFGKVHAIACGPEHAPPVLLLHAASMASPSWAPNVGPLSMRYRVYAIDNLGEAGKSELDDLARFPADTGEIGDLHVEILDGLDIGQCGVVGASNGGYNAMCLALAAPHRVAKLALLGPMGLTPLGWRTNWRLMSVGVSPSDRRVSRTAAWALGNSRPVVDGYLSWFTAVLRGVISPPPLARPESIPAADLARLAMPVLLCLGEHDSLVGRPPKAARRAASIPDLHMHVLDSGHLMGVEQAGDVNALLLDFLGSE
jgi:pimeloyl-ACP methyl ester carboxylesterase